MPFGPVLIGWAPIGDARLSLDVLHPHSNAFPTKMQVSIPLNATGEIDFLNLGRWGISVSPQSYNASSYMMANGPTDAAKLTSMTFSIRSSLTRKIWVTDRIPVQNLSDSNHTHFFTQLVNNVTTPNSNNTFAVTLNASEVAGSTLYFNVFILFPETYKGRSNGLRKDLRQNIKDLNPTFLRFPGGNNIEGYSIHSRWKWENTIASD